MTRAVTEVESFEIIIYAKLGGGGGGGGVNDYAIPRAWRGNAFWNFRRHWGVKIWKPSIGGYGYFLESPNTG